ncbi:MAG: DUF427 domain-containing protein [Chloroflexota bacterium]
MSDVSVYKQTKNTRPRESVWEYPRPPRLEDCELRVQVMFDDVVIADSTCTKRILETTHPPVYYIPRKDIVAEYLRPSNRTTFCEWKGTASYFDVVGTGREEGNAAWYYKNPTPRYARLQDHVAFYPARMDACLVDGETVRAQASGFYGGWITDEITGVEL